jgi:tetratricopeptide (TPR) repeat protein
VDTPEKIPLEQAVARDLIACSVCGAKGADVQQAGGEKHFLCARCASRGRRWRWAIFVALVVGLGFVVYAQLRHSNATPDGAISLDSPEERKKILAQIDGLLNERKYSEAIRRIDFLLSVMPTDPLFNLYRGRCAFETGHWAQSVGYLQLAMKLEPTYENVCQVLLGDALQNLGHSAQALPFLEKAAKETPESGQESAGRRLMLAECYLELERYEDSLKSLEGLPTLEPVLRGRHRALFYMGQPEKARKVFEEIDLTKTKGLKERSQLLLSMQAREEGDFAGALKILNDARASLDPKSFEATQYRRMAIMIYIESGDLAKLEEEAVELSKTSQKHLLGEALYYRALGLLLAGKKDAAVDVAKTFLTSIDLEAGFLRHEAMLMQYLAGKRKEEDLLKEASELNRFRANDVYFAMALISNNMDLAKKALESTPGHNFPYHAIQRLLANKK